MEIARNTGEQPMLVSVEELLGEGQAKSGAHGVPFAYTTFDDTRLRDVTFYVHDHLGNTRVTYTVGCDGSNGAGHLRTLEHAVDYFPYGSILREFVNSTGPEKYLTTHHERDQETGLDYRGARYFDSDVARFLSLDPLAADYTSWSPYNYVMGNPISLVDPDGRRVHDYRLNRNGHIELLKLTEDKFDRLFYSKTDESGDRVQAMYQTEDQRMMPQLRYGLATTNNGDLALDLFEVMAQGSDVEWRMTGHNKNGHNSFHLATNYSNEGVDVGMDEANKIVEFHSHTNNRDHASGVEWNGTGPLPKERSDKGQYGRTKDQLGREPSSKYVYHSSSNKMSRYTDTECDLDVDHSSNRNIEDYTI